MSKLKFPLLYQNISSALKKIEKNNLKTKNKLIEWFINFTD